MSKTWTRRLFLVQTGLIGGTLLSACRSTSRSLLENEVGIDSKLRIRKRWESGGTAKVQADFIRCIEWLKANDKVRVNGKSPYPPEDPRSFLTYDTIVEIHRNSCQHGNWFIFPWHRFYIDYFENTCRYILQDESFALPYWDWTLEPSLPPEFFSVELLKANRRMKLGDKIPDEFISQKLIDEILASDDFATIHSRSPPIIPLRGAQLTGKFERQPHNGVHNSIGGTMSDPFNSPEDPIFWLHHCNIDRIWSMWQERHPEKIVPYKVEDSTVVVVGDDKATNATPKLPTGGLLGPEFPWESNEIYLALKHVNLKNPKANKLIPDLPASPANRTVKGVVTIADVLRIVNLGYSYDSLPPLPKLQIKMKRVVKKQNRKVVLLVGDVQRSSGELKLMLPIGAKDLESGELLTRFAKDPKAWVSILATGLIEPSDPGVRSRTVLRFQLAGEYVGSHSFFGHSSHGQGPNEVGTAVDVTATLRALLKAITQASELNISVKSFEAGEEIKTSRFFDQSPAATLYLEFNFAD